MTRRVSVGDSDPATEHRPWHVYLPVKVHFFYSSCMRTVRLKTSEYALIGSHYDWLGADLFPARRGHTKRRMKNLWHPGYGRMRTTLRLPPSHHALQRFNETTVDDSWSAALIQSLAQRSLRADMYYFSLCEMGDVCPQARRRELLYMLAFSSL